MAIRSLAVRVDGLLEIVSFEAAPLSTSGNGWLAMGRFRG
jgi:hypothetical protein